MDESDKNKVVSSKGRFSSQNLSYWQSQPVEKVLYVAFRDIVDKANVLYYISNRILKIPDIDNLLVLDVTEHLQFKNVIQINLDISMNLIRIGHTLASYWAKYYSSLVSIEDKDLITADDIKSSSLKSRYYTYFNHKNISYWDSKSVEDLIDYATSEINAQIAIMQWMVMGTLDRIRVDKNAQFVRVGSFGLQQTFNEIIVPCINDILNASVTLRACAKKD